MCYVLCIVEAQLLTQPFLIPSTKRGRSQCSEARHRGTILSLKVRKANHTLYKKKVFSEALVRKKKSILHFSHVLKQHLGLWRLRLTQILNTFQLNEIQTQWTFHNLAQSPEKCLPTAAIVTWCTWEQQCAGFPQLTMPQESPHPLTLSLHSHFSGLSAEVL